MKRIISVIIAIALAVTAVSISVSAATKIEERINDLTNIFINGNTRYFTANGSGCALDQKQGGGYAHNSCSNCRLSNVTNAEWFSKAFGFKPSSSWHSGATGTYSCKAFADFAHWYIFRTDNSTPVSTYRACNNVAITVENFQKAKLGDYVQVFNYSADLWHYFIFLSIEGDTVRYIDANGNNAWSTTYGTKNGCVVDINTRTVSRFAGTYTKMNILRANNYDSLDVQGDKANNSTENNSSQTTKTPPTSYLDGIYLIETATNTNNVLDVSNAQTGNGVNIGLWKNNGNTAQHFKLDRIGNYHTITNTNSGKLLDVANGSKASGTNVWQYASNGTAAQHWQFRDAGKGYYNIVSELGTYLGVANNKAAAGDNVAVYSESAGENKQKFRFALCSDSVPDGAYIIESALQPGKVLDVVAKRTDSGANVHLWDIHGESSQQFIIMKNGNYYSITNANSGMALDVTKSSPEKNTNVQQFTPNDSKAQQWIIEKAGNGYYYIKSVVGTTLDIAGQHTENGTNIHMYTHHGDTSQKFKLIALVGSQVGRVTQPEKEGSGLADLVTGIIDSTNNAISDAASKVTAAGKSVKVTLPTFNVTLGGLNMDNAYAKYPLILYKNITYFPMTYYDMRLLGVATDYSPEEGLKVFPTNETIAYKKDTVSSRNSSTQTATIATGRITVNGRVINNATEQYPFLLFRDVTYFPLTWDFAHDEFGWYYNYTTETGLVIDK